MFDLFAELSGLTQAVKDNTLAVVRIAEALERISPPPAALPTCSLCHCTSGNPMYRDCACNCHRLDERSETGRDSGMASGPGGPDPGPVLGPSMAETGEEYDARQSWESQLALSLGFSPGAPVVQALLRQMRDDMMIPRTGTGTSEEGTPQESPGLSETEAIQAVKDAFEEALGQQNARP